MSNGAELRTYFEQIERAYRAGNATEHTYRPYLKTLLEQLAPGVTAVNEPKRVACGAPDYAVTRRYPSGPRTIGWIEAKDVGASLHEIERSPQLRERYIPNLPNLVLTDYLEFRWYVDGKPRGQARLATIAPGHRLTWDAEGARQTAGLLGEMLARRAPDITSADELARRMAALAHMLREVALATLQSDAAEAKTAREALADLYEAFKTTLIPDLSHETFADMFAQTLAYGLLAARDNHSGAQPFTRHDAAREIPHSNPFLRRLFATIEGPDLEDAPYIGFVDDLAQLLATSNMDTILRDFGKRTRTEDPIVHFYEPFLQAYDQRLRELRGVYYTPDPVVAYITQSVEAVLKRDFGVSEGLADGGVMLLDPACGTGTFPARVISLIRERFMARNNAGAWASYVRERLLPRVLGFELLMAPYAMAHLRLGMQLAGLDLPDGAREMWGVRAGDNERLGIYLTNTLEEAAFHSNLLLGKYISDEANAAARVKRDAPVMVVLGNPPYSGTSANNGQWISALLRGEDLTNTQGEKLLDRGKGTPTGNYFAVDGEKLGERNPKWLNDDYVKFIRFAQWRIERTEHGVLAFITNHGYLDNPTFRGMRQSLMASFDEIYVLNLHGNSKKKERAPDGGKDENVFDIQQGVAIGIFIRRPGAPGASRHARVYHADLWGGREGKYRWLAEHDVGTTEWAEVQPHAPFYLFVPRDIDFEKEYEQGWRITNMMPVNVLGFQTHRDNFAIAFDEATMRRRLAEMRDPRMSDSAFAAKYELSDSAEWQVATARRQLQSDQNWQAALISCLYRPFDWRSCYFSEIAMDRPRRELKQHMTRPNLSVNLPRQTKEDVWRHAVVANSPTPALYTEIKDGSNAFPLYLYPDPTRPTLLDTEEPSSAPGGRRPNLAPAFIRDCSARLGLAWVADGRGDRAQTFGPEDVFSYVYAVLHAPTYRERYADFLKTDFPRIPLTSDAGLFRELCELGDTLVGLHLMERAAEAPASFPARGSNVVEAVRYVAAGEASHGAAGRGGSPDLTPYPPLPQERGDQSADGRVGEGDRAGRVYINREQYFEGVTPEVWEFHVGGYQVAEKWLKDRRGRTLAYDDITHYGKVVSALGETIRLMEAVDEVIEEHGGWPLGGANGETAG